MTNTTEQIQKAIEHVKQFEAEGRIKSLVLTKLEEALLWASKLD